MDEIEIFIDKYYKKAIYESDQAEKLAKHSKRLNDNYLYWKGVRNALRNVSYGLGYVNRQLKRKGIT